MVELVELEREPRPDLVGRPAFHLTGRLLELGLQLDDHPLPHRAARAHPFDRRARRAEDGLVDDDAPGSRATVPGRRCRRARRGCARAHPARRAAPMAARAAGAAAARLDGNSWRIAGSALIDGRPQRRRRVASPRRRRRRRFVAPLSRGTLPAPAHLVRRGMGATAVDASQGHAPCLADGCVTRSFSWCRRGAPCPRGGGTRAAGSRARRASSPSPAHTSGGAAAPRHRHPTSRASS